MDNKYKDIGSNQTRCPRAYLKINNESDVNIKDAFQQFSKKFNDSTISYSSCRLEKFITERHSADIKNFITQASLLSSKTSQENRGFVEITAQLNQIIEGSIKISCSLCSRIGDAIIALEAPDNMQLEHTDYSFNHLCDFIGKSHKLHLSEYAFYYK